MNQIGIGIIGAGRVCHGHARSALALQSTRLVAIADIDAERAHAAAEQHGARPYTDYREMLAADDVDAVICGLPHWLHVESTLAAAEAGKHILVEKPMAMTVAECDQMIEAARKTGVVLAIGHTHHFMAVNLEVKRLVDSGEIGNVVLATDTWYKPFWDRGQRAPWFLDDSKGGGMWSMNGTHMIDRMSFMLGVEAVAVKARIGNPTWGKSTDMGVAFLEMSNGVPVTILHAGYREGVSRFEGEIIGTEAHVKFTNRRLHRNRDEEWVEAPVDEPVVELKEGQELRWTSFAWEMDDFARAIMEKRPPAVPGEYGRYVVNVLTACEESSRTGREVRLD